MSTRALKKWALLLVIWVGLQLEQLRATDLTVTGSLTVNETVDIEGSTLTLGTRTDNSNPGWQVFYTDGTCSTLELDASRGHNTWLWQQNGGATAQLQMSLSGTNSLVLYDQSSPPVAQITLNPTGTSTFANSITLNGADNEMPQPDAYDDAQSGSVEAISRAKNNQTLGQIKTYVNTYGPAPFPYPNTNGVNGSYLTTGSYTVNHTPVNFTPIDISTVGVALGTTSSPANSFTYYNGAKTNIAGTPSLVALNHQTRNVTVGGTVTATVECPQILGTDAAAKYTLFQYNPNTSQFEANHLDDLIGTNTGWTNFYASSGNSINDFGEVIGTGTYTNAGSNTNYASGTHALLLLPCQFRLLNGSTNTADVDGMDFSGNRPTTITATTSYVDAITEANDLSGNEGTNVIGGDLPLGMGRPTLAGQCYTYSLMMLAKVSPPAATNITYAWGRVYQDRSVTISQTTTNTWYVTTAISSPTGVPTPVYDTESVPGVSDGFYTTTPSTNNNVVSFYDNPAMNLALFTGTASHTNDFAYEKTDFTYSLTNSIGSASAVVTQHVGQILVAKRIATTGTITTDWSGIKNIVSTTNIPSCLTVSTNEIRAIVAPSTNQIIFDSSVPSSP